MVGESPVRELLGRIAEVEFEWRNGSAAGSFRCEREEYLVPYAEEFLNRVISSAANRDEAAGRPDWSCRLR